MRTLRGITILKNNKKLCELIVSKTLCSLWLPFDITQTKLQGAA